MRQDAFFTIGRRPTGHGRFEPFIRSSRFVPFASVRYFVKKKIQFPSRDSQGAYFLCSNIGKMPIHHSVQQKNVRRDARGDKVWIWLRMYFCTFFMLHTVLICIIFTFLTTFLVLDILDSLFMLCMTTFLWFRLTHSGELDDSEEGLGLCEDDPPPDLVDHEEDAVVLLELGDDRGVAADLLALWKGV